MIQQLTSPSNYSINEEALRLNGSSMISPSQSNFDSNYKNNLIDFEEFTQSQSRQHQATKGQCGKKKLTIRIDQSYQFKQNAENLQRPALAFQKSNEKCHQSATSPMSDFNLISPIDRNEANMHKYYELVKQMQNMQEKLEYQQNTMSKLTERIQEHVQKLKLSQSQNIFLKKQLQIKDALLIQKDRAINQLRKKHEIDLMEADQKKKEKEYKMKQMLKISEKLKNINKDLVVQVKISEKRVRDLQKQLQKNICIASQQNINKLKESSLRLKDTQRYSQNNKQNSLINGQRKSLQRKKTATNLSSGSGQVSKKSQRIMSSTSSILTKKLTQK